MRPRWILFVCYALLLTACVIADEQPEEKDPWDKSTDKYVNRGSNGNENEDLNVDVTEESESEVHTERSKVGKHKEKKQHSDKVDSETKEQFNDAIDETDPADDIQPKSEKNYEENKGSKKGDFEKKQFNYHGDFYPGSLWEYPYPYFHPQYGCGAPIDCPCAKGDQEEPKEEAKDDGEAPAPPALHPKPKTRKKQLLPTHYYGPPSAGWGGFQPGHTGGGWGAPYWHKKRSHTHRQLIPTHYYGPPSAGWGGFQPGHTGGGWGAPYWYKKRAETSHTHRQLVPTHYYGPPSAGWGGFQPGHTGGGWGAPYWYKKRTHTHRQLVPTHYYGPPSAGWGGFQPGHTGSGWGAPYWYKSKVNKPTNKKISKHVKASRKFVVGKDNGFGHTGNDGWDSGFGNGFGHSWGAPNEYGMGPSTYEEGGPHTIDYDVWHGANSLGAKGWGGSGWIGDNEGTEDYGYIHGGHGAPLNGQAGFGSGFAGWGNVGGDMEHLDQVIGQGDLGTWGHNIKDHGSGHLGHNSLNQAIGYGPVGGHKSKVRQQIQKAAHVSIPESTVTNQNNKNVKDQTPKILSKVTETKVVPKMTAAAKTKIVSKITAATKNDVAAKTRMPKPSSHNIVPLTNTKKTQPLGPQKIMEKKHVHTRATNEKPIDE